ncbi:MAG TPA: hypothetical protein VIK59_09655 [Verrucomicrobiae bacterium]
MKTRFSIYASALVLAGLLAALDSGCKKKQTVEQNSNAPTIRSQTNSPVVPAEKTSFNEVTSQLDPGGDFYLYLGTAQWLEHLSSKVENLRQRLPAASAGEATNINKAFDLLTRLIQDSGVQDISGVGLSSIEIEKGLYHNKALLHHYPDKGSGFLWKLGGDQPHAFTGLDFLPTNTALAVFSDMDVTLLWSVAQNELDKSQFPKARALLQKVPEEFEKKTQVGWDQFLKSLGGEFGFVLTLDDSNMIPIPLGGQLIQIPEPGLLLVAKVKDDTIFNRIDQELKKNPQVIKGDKAGLKMRTMPLPLPMAFNLRPTAASSGGYLFIASSDALVEEALAIKDGKKPGLKSTAEFKRLSQNIPDQGNQFSYMSERFGQILFEVQKQAIANGSKSTPEQMRWIQSLLRQNRPAFAYTVGINAPDGCMTIGNGSQSYAMTALLPAVAVPGMLAAIAIPNFVKARATAQKNACINNLRQMDAAKQQWALENNKKSTDIPTWNDLKPYLRGPVPLICPDGGAYSLNAVGEAPTCSIPGHQLP